MDSIDRILVSLDQVAAAARHLAIAFQKWEAVINAVDQRRASAEKSA